MIEGFYFGFLIGIIIGYPIGIIVWNIIINEFKGVKKLPTPKSKRPSERKEDLK